MSTSAIDQVVRATGLLVIEVVNSNPNGDPDREGDPRQRPDGKGEISPVSFKRKTRDLVEQKEGPVWKSLAESLSLTDDQFGILESRQTALKDIRAGDEAEFIKRFWDGRLFGNTELEKGRNVPVKTGVAQFGLGLSIAPVRIDRMTTTNPPVEGDKKVGMAPLGYRIVEHGVYCMPYFINPTAACKSGCTKRDIALLLALIRHAYPHTASYVRPMVEIRHAWYIEHKNALGSCSDFALIAALTPTKKGDKGQASTCWDDYECPTFKSQAFANLAAKVGNHRDLMDLS